MARRARTTISAEQLEAREVPATAFALGTGGIGANTLFRFDTATPGTLSVGIPVTGLDAGETVVGIDFRPANGQLYGLAVDAALHGGADRVFRALLAHPLVGQADRARELTDRLLAANTDFLAWAR